MQTQFGKIATGVGFSKTSGNIKKRSTRQHTKADIGQTFVDDFGKSYVYTQFGKLY